ncbi:hypothetical protein [Xanthomonas nasturtii]|uniref:hypothetical protein n=1 Tax=Xanthomonas nasturtii TaxID=1843581 RepID=UPI002011A296|nr:hypothetical protein [Xanthomonas nasturtii]MCL1501276.1 hypothetical protein [Xanthomonas nasturtii]MCL1505083.1 hypothetical protein [Xanthomonas nasturtii]MCL1524971.1 hypothetical protein [Xanthomonas nasturtii]
MKYLFLPIVGACFLLIPACKPDSATSIGAGATEASAPDQVEGSSGSPLQKDLKVPVTINSKLNDQGVLKEKINEIAVLIKAQNCTEDSPGTMLCNRSPIVEVTFLGGTPITVEPEALSG